MGSLGNNDEAEAEAWRGLLEPGETMRVFGSLTRPHGDSGPTDHREPHAPGASRRFWNFATRTWPRKIVFFTLGAPLLLIAAIDSGMSRRWLDRLIGGRVCSGAPGTHARLMEHAFNPLSGGGVNRTRSTAVTDRRLLVARMSIFGAKNPEIAWSLPLRHVAGATRRRRLWFRRLQLSFDDGSWIVLSAPLLDAPSPKRWVEATYR